MRNQCHNKQEIYTHYLFSKSNADATSGSIYLRKSIIFYLKILNGLISNSIIDDLRDRYDMISYD